MATCTLAQAVQRSLLSQQVALLVQAVVSQPTFPEILASAVLEAYPTEGGAAIQPARYVRCAFCLFFVCALTRLHSAHQMLCPHFNNSHFLRSINSDTVGWCPAGSPLWVPVRCMAASWARRTRQTPINMMQTLVPPSSVPGKVSNFYLRRSFCFMSPLFISFFVFVFYFQFLLSSFRSLFRVRE